MIHGSKIKNTKPWEYKHGPLLQDFAKECNCNIEYKLIETPHNILICSYCLGYVAIKYGD